ncbi:MAG: permease-like cell division protein FtsX [Bacilli bacterium]|jgi:cell division transport system permease protein|nr:permease-like cell division protein FtsX [Bacilli bacterium]
MKLFRMFGRSIRDAYRSVIRNFSLSLASISCITVTLVIVSLFTMASYNVDNFTKLIKRDVTVVVFLDNDITPEEINAMETKISQMDNIAKYEFKSKLEIKEQMQSSSDVFDRIMSNWDNKENPLQDTFLIKVIQIEKIKETAAALSALDKVSVVKYGEGMVEKLVFIFSVIEKGTAGLVIGLLIVTAFLIANTIKITIFSRQTEISIMRLVGASNLAIRLPYIIEGLFLGILGSVIPIIITIYGYTIFYGYFEGQLFSPLIRLVSPYPFIYIISLCLLGIGMVVGMWGSARAVRRHLKI